MVQMVKPSILKSHKRSKMIEIHFYRLYSIMTGFKIIVSYPSKVWHLILQLLSVFYCQFVVILARICPICAFFVEETDPLLGPMADQWE